MHTRVIEKNECVEKAQSSNNNHYETDSSLGQLLVTWLSVFMQWEYTGGSLWVAVLVVEMLRKVSAGGGELFFSAAISESILLTVKENINKKDLLSGGSDCWKCYLTLEVGIQSFVGLFQ